MRALSLSLAVIAGLLAAGTAVADDATDTALRAAFNTPDRASARRAFAPLAAAGNAAAQFYYGMLLLRGDGGGADPGDARDWLQRAADQGHPVAQFQLGEIHRVGKGVAADAAAAARWYGDAAEGGWFGAQRALAGMLADGDGVPRDTVEALKWYDVAAEMGLDPYNGARDRLAAAMDAAAIAEARRRAEAWLGAHREWNRAANAAIAATGEAREGK